MTRCGRVWVLSERSECCRVKVLATIEAHRASSRRSAYRHPTFPHLLRGPVDCPETEEFYSGGSARIVCVLVQEHSASGSAT